jgi:hypothetical protein|tara:strand:- start:23757 stop:23966 length:210 start_codon:yes stop_codon:yes gene_type:complete
MVAMGGGPEVPSKESGKKELVLCTLPWPEEGAKKGLDGLKEEFKDVEVKYFHSVFNNGKSEPLDVPEGM